MAHLIVDVLDEEELLDLLTNGHPPREVYRAQNDRGWFVTYGGGRTTTQAVDRLFKAGKINSVYSNCPHEAYHVGRTMDIDKTVQERKRLGNNKVKIYVGDKYPYVDHQ